MKFTYSILVTIACIRAIRMQSPCVQNPIFQCNGHGRCNALTNYPYFKCVCDKGYIGSRCEKRTNFGNLYPYGTAYNDSVFIAAGDESTHRIPLQAGFLFFGEHYSSAFINGNGYMTLSRDYTGSRPDKLPTNKTSFPVLAPFWADSDSSGVTCDCTPGCHTCGTSVVYYQIYTTFRGDMERYKNRAMIEGRTKCKLRTFRRPDWVMVVTWSRMVPSPYSSNQHSTERNTFQVVLAMDTVSKKSIVSFRYDELTWRERRTAVVGYQSGATGHHYNHVGSTHELHLTEGFQCDPTVPNRLAERGVLLFATSGSPMYESQICRDWLESEAMMMIFPIRDKVSLLPSCPCVGFQARFSPDHVQLSGTDCFVTISRDVTVSHNGASGYLEMRCCYDHNVGAWDDAWRQVEGGWSGHPLGDLITHPVYEAGGLYWIRPAEGDVQSIYERDRQVKDHCCRFTNNCRAYHDIRVIDKCTNYTAPTIVDDLQ